MNPAKVGKFSAILVLAGILVLISERPFVGHKPRNINVILLTADSLRPDHLGCYGYRRGTSPNIDAIARKGQLFRRAYSQSAWTIPGLMSILTSLQPPVHQVEERGHMLDPQITTIFDCFGEAGYTLPNICFILSLPEFSTIRMGPVEERYFRGDEGEELFKWLDDNHDSKFFLWYHYRNVHLPYRPKERSHSMVLKEMPSEELLSPGVRAVLSEAASVPVGTVKFEQSDRPMIEDLYDSEVREFDAFVGRLYVRLQKYGLIEKTLIVITSDHGEELLDHGFVGHASTSHSASLYDEILRIPLIMSMADSLPGDVQIREQVQQIDIMPTILDIADIPIPPGIQGRSLARLIFDPHEQNETSIPVFAETVFGGFQATEEMSKIRLRCVRTDAWKLIETEGPDGKSYQFFDLLFDLREHHNIYDDNPGAASKFETLLTEWKRENKIRKNAIAAGAKIDISGDGQAVCPQIIFPYDGVALRLGERNGIVRASWTGSPTSTYVIEYEIGTGVHHLTGSFLTFGNQRDFGPYSREIWDSLAARNPWRVRISPDTHPRCWSEWFQFTFE